MAPFLHFLFGFIIFIPNLTYFCFSFQEKFFNQRQKDFEGKAEAARTVLQEHNSV